MAGKINTRFSTIARRCGVGLGALLAGLGWAMPTWGCDYSGPAAAATATRTYRHGQPALAFEIPANYRAMKTRRGTVQFHDPATFAYIQCQVNARPYPRLPQGTTLEVRPVPAAVSGLPNLVQRMRPWLVLHQPRYEWVPLGEGEALLSRYTHHVYGTAMVSLTFLSRDDALLITLEGPAETPVIPLALESLSF